MTDIELNERFANMWRQSRTNAGKSQNYMAQHLGVSKRTVQNWEDGLSCPNQLTAIKWFKVLEVQALPYYLKALYPHEFEMLEFKNDDDLERALIQYIKLLSAEDKKKLFFVIYGEHGSSFPELIEMLTAHFHTPDENRITIAQNICTNFEIAKATGNLITPDKIMPDISVLKKAIIKKRNKILGTNDEYKE